MRNKIFSLLLLVSLFNACKPGEPSTESPASIQTFSGKTMGTYYQIRYIGDNIEGLQVQIDSLLELLDFELSTYNPASVISKINKGEAFPEIQTSQSTVHFLKNFQLAKEIYKTTNGYFDPSVMPLVNYWGFGYDPSAMAQKVDTTKVDSIRQFIGFDKVQLLQPTKDAELISIVKDNPSVQIDLSAIAKGYGVDQLAHLLETNGVDKYLVDIGGEVVGKGHKAINTPWYIGIATPLEGAVPSDYMAASVIENCALATSGNYRNFHEIDGVKYSHTINPFTGFPERSPLLSASIMAKDCATADALATACMVAGLENGYDMIDAISGVEAFFVYSDDNGELQTKATAGFPEVKAN